MTKYKMVNPLGLKEISFEVEKIINQLIERHYIEEIKE